MENRSIVVVILYLFIISFFCSCDGSKYSEKTILRGIVPLPLEMSEGNGVFRFNNQTVFFVENEEQAGIAKQLADKISRSTIWSVTIKDGEPDNKNVVTFSTVSGMTDEEYQLNITTDRIEVSASGPAGFFYAIQTLRQLLPVEIEIGDGNLSSCDVPVVMIRDKPRFKWRGYMLDVARHFFTKDEVLQLIDDLALYKINVLHLHLTDDQGWRIQIDKYPKLTEVGAWRVNREDLHWNSRPKQKPGEKAAYGGFYTKSDISKIVDYAKKRHIQVIPEIEMPAHVTSLLAAYPELSCTGGPFTVLPGGVWPITDICCAGKEHTFEFLENVLSEIMEMFPSQYIHIGGDEANKKEWEECLKCQKRIKDEGLKDEGELQSYFIKRIEKFINSKGKVMIGWDEIIEGGLAPQATVMSWRGFQGGIEAARQGHDVVMTPTQFCYFDYYQGPVDQEPLAIGGYLPLSKVYAFEPIPEELGEEGYKHILGGQANLWTEYVPDLAHLQYMTFPRLAAMAEVNWTSKDKKDWNNFMVRMEDHWNRYDAMGINYSKSAFLVQIESAIDTVNHVINVRMFTEASQGKIHYTTNGSVPTPDAAVYTKPIEIDKSMTFRAQVFHNGRPLGNEVTEKFKFHIGALKNVAYLIPYSKKYSGSGKYTLVDVLRGSKNFGDGKWQGWFGENMEVIIDIGSSQSISQISVGTFQQPGSWIYFPESVTVYFSDDGKIFHELGIVENVINGQAGNAKKEFSLNTKGIKSQFIKVVAKNMGVIPEGNVGAGDMPWLFVDEIVIE